MKIKIAGNIAVLLTVIACFSMFGFSAQHNYTDLKSLGFTEVINNANSAAYTTADKTEANNCVMCKRLIVEQTGLAEGRYCWVCQTNIFPQQTDPNNTTASLCKLYGILGQHSCLLNNATFASWNNYGTFTDTQYNKTMNYRVFLPINYDPSKEYPMLIYMHGLGFESKDINEIGINTLLSQAVAQTKREVICVIPQCLPNQYWPVNPYTTEIAFHLFEELQRHLSVDKSRIYVSGHSYGSMGTLLLLENHPNYFAGAMIAAGAATSYTNYENIATTPIWMFCGDQDTGFAAKLSNLYNKLVALKADVKYTVWPGQGHGTFSYSAQNSEVTKWLLAQRLY